MNTITIPVSAGELIDKLTILDIKHERIADSEKLANVARERTLLTDAAAMLLDNNAVATARHDLKRVNERLWVVEDRLREHEREQTFDPEFITLARSVYHLNDERAAIKRDINLAVGSALVEEKSYAPYSSSAIDS